MADASSASGSGASSHLQYVSLYQNLERANLEKAKTALNEAMSVAFPKAGDWRQSIPATALQAYANINRTPSDFRSKKDEPLSELSAMETPAEGEGLLVEEDRVRAPFQEWFNA